MAKDEYLKYDEIDLRELVKTLFGNTFAILGRADELFDK